VLKRVLSWSLIALVVLSFATFGTARARQVASVDDAQHRLTLAQRSAARSISRAASDGMTSRELGTFRRQTRTLAGMARPQAMPLWDPSSAKFFDRQSTAYRRLAKGVRAAEARVTTESKILASASLAGLSSDIGTAASLDLNVSRANKTSNDERAALAGSSTIRAYRGVMKAVASARAALQAPIKTRMRQVQEVLSKSGGNLSGVLALADAQTQTTQKSLALLGLLTTRTQRYRSDLTRLNATMHAQTSAFAAAVKEGALDAEAKTIATDYARTVPTKMIVVSTENQQADMYERSQIVYSTDVTTGGPELPTDHGVFHIYLKTTPFVFHSPWPVGSPYYYNPTPVQFWMPFDGGEGLHDASWRSNFGPGSNLAPTDLGTGNSILGTHGCVNLPFAAAQFVWDWAPVGTTVVVV
jgi:lipoprotein-anchoring transpeptidase ErfK/SrfK